MNYFLNDDAKVAPSEMVKVHDYQVKIDFELVEDVVVASLTVVRLTAVV